MELYVKYKTQFKKYGLDNDLKIAHFMAQIEHESNLKPVQENLNYSAERLLQIFPKYFDKKTAAKYAHKPIQIANKVYSNRYGNGSESSGDGYKYSGKGFIQTTFKANYEELTKATGIDFVAQPHLLLEEANAIIAALYYWKSRGCNELAMTDNVVAITKKINGGTNGLDDRKTKLKKWKTFFNEK